MPLPDRSKAISARLAAGLVACVLATTGCAGAKRSPAASAPSPGSTDAPAGGSVAPGTSSGPSGRAATPRPSPTGPPKPIPDDPAKAVGVWLTALGSNDYATLHEGSAEAVRALVAIRDIIAQENARRGATTTNSVEVAEQPRTTARSRDTATVSMRVTNKAVVSGEKGTLPEDTEIAGPVTLKRIAGVWRLSDLSYGGSALQPGYLPVDARRSKEGFTLAVGSILSYKRTTAALIRFVADGGGRVPIAVRSASLFGPDKAEHPWVQFAFESKDTPAGFLGFERIDGKPISLHVEVQRQDTDAAWAYDIDL